MCLSLCSRLCHWGPLVALGKKNLRKYHTCYLNTAVLVDKYVKKPFYSQSSSIPLESLHWFLGTCFCLNASNLRNS